MERVPRCIYFSLLAIAAAGCSNALTRRAPPPSDAHVAASALIARVNHALMAAGVADYARIRIAATRGEVTLEGTLPSAAAAADAVAIAGSVDGVERVIDLLTVVGEPR